MLSIVAILSILGISYSYFGYPLVLVVINFFIKHKRASDSFSKPDSATIIITCRNEEGIIAEKLENTLALKIGKNTVLEELKNPNSKVQVIVASDASNDDTHAIVEGYESIGVMLVKLDQRKGKESAQKEAIKYAEHPIIVFTDAKIFLASDILNNILEEFSDPSVGAVSSKDKVIDQGGTSGEGAYVKYEMWIRKLETKIYSLVGLSGSCFAVHKDITSNFPTEVPSDFCMLIEARKSGLRGVHSDSVIAEYKAVVSSEAEFSRKVRTVVRGMRSVWLYKKDLYIPTDKFLLFQILSHKICRWLVPFFMIFSFVASFILFLNSVIWMLIFVGYVLLFGLALKGHLDAASRENIFVKLSLFLVLSNLGILIAWFKFLTGDKQVSWNPSVKG